MTASPHRVALTRLTELWIHTGTACNLECAFCLEGSRPGDTRLERVKLSEIKPYLDAAVELGVERFGFTGGEPLIVKDIVKILDYALSLKPCLILSNGTAPLLKRVHQLQQLKAKPNALSFRISIDYPDQARHDAARGWGNFGRAIEGLQLLESQGFAISIARQVDANEDPAQVLQAYRLLLRKAHLPEDLSILPLPDFGKLGTESLIEPLTPPAHTHRLMCSHSRMLLKKAGQLRLYACAFTDDDARFDLGNSLTEAVTQPVCLEHQRCRQCVNHAATYSQEQMIHD